MIKEYIKKKVPLIYSCYMYVKTGRKFKKGKTFEKQFLKFTDKELEKYDAHLYAIRQNKQLDWNNLQTYTEKMQWAKLYDKDPKKVVCADKYAVRKWVEDRIGEEYLIPLIGVYDSYADVDFSKLPNQFVIKTNHGSGDVVCVRDKRKMTLADKIDMRRKVAFSLDTDYSCKYCEMHYGKIPPKIIVEQLIDNHGKDLPDYKFLCFDGEPKYVWIDVDRFTNHKRNVYNMNWELQEWNQRGYGNTDYPIEKPENFDQMVEIVKKLAAGFSHVRVDLYSVQGKIYFGEMTFTNGSGFEELVPAYADKMLGDMWNLEMVK
nr:ATP-grasp fold amidoligase family protein [uncultured Blautia sp.]